jgi:DNA-directed RNA polymerase subunit L
MEPTIHNIESAGDETEFIVKNCNVSFMNALRRTILSQIPTVVFRTTPYEKSLVQIRENTCRLNNEIIKQRLSCIPIHIVDETIDLDDYVVELDEENDTNSIRYITTEHMKIKNIKTDKYLDRKEVQRIFPKNSLTNEYVLITRLRPIMNNEGVGESIRFTAKMVRASACEDGCFNVASTCTYSMLQDPVKQKEAWNAKETQYKAQGLGTEEIMDEKENWYNHDAKRIYQENAYKFKLETIGVYTNSELVNKACEIMKEKFTKLLQSIDGRTISVEKSETLMNAFDVKLEGEDYSVGKSLEYALYSKFYEREGVFDYVAFRKFHPHDSYSVIRVSFKDNTTSKEEVYGFLKQGCIDSIQVFEDIQKNFT